MLEKNIRIEEFCDMEQLYALIDNWSSSTGMSAVIIDAEGRRTSESFGMTPFCSMIHQTEKGMELCGGTWKCDLLGVYECPMGLYDTLNLTNGKYSLIEGTGMTKFIEIFRSTDDYETAYNRKLAYIEPDYISHFVGICSLEALRGRKDTTGFIGSLEYGAITEHGEEWHEINVFIITNEMGEPMANILGRDITEAHDKADTLAQLEIAQRANEAKSLFLSNMSHDIRTPMNGIIGMTAIANTHIDDKERVKDCLGKISVASRHLLSLINDILDLSKIESGSIALSEESFSISELLDNMVNMLSPQMRSKGQQFRFHIDRVTHEKVIGDAVKLQQVFTNILSNAIKYTPDGGSISVEFNEKPADSSRVAEYEFICTDNGYGMSEDYLKKLFEPFERAGRAYQKYTGHGSGHGHNKKYRADDGRRYCG